jgi:hypothetical protein
MKEKDLIVDCPYQQVILYAEKGDGTYGPFQTGSYMAGYHISEHFKITDHLNKSLLEQLRNGEISPVCYFMMIEGLTVPELAGRTGISKACVKRHITPGGFQKMRISTLKRYADVLNIPLANMFQIISTIEDGNWDMGYQGEIDHSKSGTISQTKTKNPILIETKVINNDKNNK